MMAVKEPGAKYSAFRKSTLLSVSVLILSISSTAFSQSMTPLGSLIHGDYTPDGFGHSVDVSDDGSRFIVGARTGDNGEGYVKVYDQVDGVVTQIGATLSGTSNDDRFGSAVAISSDGSMIAIGAPTDGGLGYVQTFELNGGNWTQVGTTLTTNAIDENFGHAIDLNGTGSQLAIGAYTADSIEQNSGRVSIYTLIGGNWVQDGTDLLGDNTADTGFGYSLEFSENGTTLAVGANVFNTQISSYVHVYRNVQGAWTMLGNGFNPSGQYYVGSGFGDDVSLSADGNTLAIGAPMYSEFGAVNGRVEVYNYDNNQWTQVGDIIHGALNSVTGNAVSLSNDGELLAVGSSEFTGFGIAPNLGGVSQVYYLDEINNTWLPECDFAVAEEENLFGHTTELSGNGTVLITGGPGTGGLFAAAKPGVAHAHLLCGYTLGIDPITEQSVQVATNPTTQELYITGFEGNQFDLIFTDLSGRQVTVPFLRHDGEKQVFSLEYLSKGSYVVFSEMALGQFIQF